LNNKNEKKNNYGIKWQHKLVLFAVIITIVPALIIGLQLIDKTEQELTQSVNFELANTTNIVSNRINQFFTSQLDRLYLIKKSIESETLGVNEKVAIIVSAVGSVKEVESITLFFKEQSGYTTAVQSREELLDSLVTTNNSEVINLIKNQESVLESLIKEKKNFGNPVYVEALKKWFVYSVIPVTIENTPEAYLVGILNLSLLQEEFQDPLYSAVGSIIITNAERETIFKSDVEISDEDIVIDAIKMLSGKSRITEVTNYNIGDKKYVVSMAFPENINWVVIAIENYDKAYAVVAEMNKTFYLWIFIGIILTIIMALIIIQIIRRPINHLVEKAKEISSGNFDIEVEYKLDDSIGTLGSTMESMSKSLKENFLRIEKQNIELEDYSKTLEQKVLDRTKKLKETNDDLQKAYLKVLELNNEKNEFLGIVAHDLKNPLGAIKGFGAIIKENEDLSDEDLEEFAGIIVDSSERMFDIITSLLDINKIEEGRIEVKYQEISANELIDILVKQNSDLASKKDITINVSKLSQDIRITTDKTLVMQVLDNFLSNAIKFSPSEKAITVSIENKPDFISVSVKDEGPGLSEDDKSKLFQKFSKLSARPTAGENSTGLGLSIAKKITEMLGGTIEVFSEKGNGAEFKIILPK